MGRLQALTQNSDLLTYLSGEGRVYYASDTDQNDLVTGQTSFADTTPTFILDVPDGTTAIPLMVRLSQTGTVAGGAIDVIVEIDNADRYNTGGTSETVLGSKTTGARTNACALYSGATANARYGIRLMGMTIGQDVSPAEGSPNEIVWTPAAGLDFIVGPGAFLVYTYAGTTGPTWFWTVKWAEIPTNWVQ